MNDLKELFADAKKSIDETISAGRELREAGKRLRIAVYPDAPPQTRTIEAPPLNMLVYSAQGCKACNTRIGARFCHRCGSESTASIIKRIGDSIRGESVVTIPTMKTDDLNKTLYKVEQLEIPKLPPPPANIKIRHGDLAASVLIGIFLAIVILAIVARLIVGILP